MDIISRLRRVLTKPGRRPKIIFASLFTILAILPFFLYLSGSIGTDEGCYMFIASNIEDLPHSLSFHSPPPGIYYLLALLFSIFGKSFYVARAAVFISNALSAILLLFIGRKLWGQKEGMLASLLFLVGVLIPAFGGYYAMTEPFMVLFLLLGVLFFLKSEKRAIYLVLSGVAVGLSILFKQFAGLLLLSMIAFYLCRLWPREKRNRERLVNSIKELSLICSGVLIPILAAAAYLWSVNGFDEFIQDMMLMMHYPRNLSLYSLAYLFASYSIVWFFSVVSVLAIAYQFVTKRGWNKEVFVAIWLIFSLYPLTHQQYGHYIVSILPPACLLASLSLSKAYPVVLSIRKIKNSLFQREYVRIFTTVCAFALTLSMISVIAYSGYHGHKDRASLFDAQLRTANYIQSHTEETDKIFAFTKGPSIHFLSGRHPPLRFFYIAEVLVPDENAENEVIDRLEESNVKYIVVTNREVMTDTTFRFWRIAKYIQDNYVIDKSIDRFDIYKKSS